LYAAADLIVTRASVLSANAAAPAGRDVSKWGPLVDLAAADPDITECARLFQELQEQRHAADYVTSPCSIRPLSSAPSRMLKRAERISHRLQPRVGKASPGCSSSVGRTFRVAERVAARVVA
jgi:hypothetical protein